MNRKSVVPAVAAGLMVAAFAVPRHVPDVSWAFPTLTAPRTEAPSTIHRLPGSNREFTEAKVRDTAHAVDWRPEGKPAPPWIVSEGHPPGVLPCARMVQVLAKLEPADLVDLAAYAGSLHP